MSIIINVSNREKDNSNSLNNTKISKEYNICPNNNQFEETNCIYTSDKTIFKLIRPNDLSKIDIVIENEIPIEVANNISNMKNTSNNQGVNDEKRDNVIITNFTEIKQVNQIKQSHNTKEKNSSSVKIDINNSFMSTGSGIENKKKIQTKNSTNQNDESITWEKKFTLQTNERIIFDEMNRIEAENNNDHMENLNNLSKIMKNKSLSSKFNKNLSTENLFLYKNILSSKHIKHNEFKEISIVNQDKKNYENYNNRELNNLSKRNGLNNGFIFEDSNHRNENTDEGSSKTINCQINKENKGKIAPVSCIASNNIKGDVNNKLSERIENIKNSLNKYSSTGNVNSASHNYISNSISNPIKSKNSSVELTCFQKLCGNK